MADEIDVFIDVDGNLARSENSSRALRMFDNRYLLLERGMNDKYECRGMGVGPIDGFKWLAGEEVETVNEFELSFNGQLRFKDK